MKNKRANKVMIMEKKVSIYFTPVDGCEDTFCQFRKSCTFHTGEELHMDVHLLNSILQNCHLHMDYIERLYFAVKGNSQVYPHASDIDLGKYPSRCVMSFTYPYPVDSFPTNMGKMYRVDSVNEIKYLMALPDFWGREISKLYTVASKRNIDDLSDILYEINELRWKRTFLYTVNSIKWEPEFFVGEKTILPILMKYQYTKMEDTHLTCNRRNGLNITVDYLGRAKLCQQEDTAFEWTDYKDVHRRILESFHNSAKCASCLKKKEVEWRYAIS